MLKTRHFIYELHVFDMNKHYKNIDNGNIQNEIS